MNIPVLFQDHAIVAINKPSGIVTNNAQSVKTETIQDWAHGTLQISPDTADSDFYRRDGIVHRLDKETSGVMLLAKTIDAFTSLQSQFKDRLIQKSYLALTHGKVVPERGEIRVPVGRLPWNRKRFGVVPEGKPAVSTYSVIDSGTRAAEKKTEHFTLVSFHPRTGRTHQIRVHCKYIEHPIAGDMLYAGRKIARSDRTWIPRVMLHASRITFHHPDTGKDVTVEAPVPEDMHNVLHEVGISLP